MKARPGQYIVTEKKGPLFTFPNEFKLQTCVYAHENTEESEQSVDFVDFP